MNPGITYKSSGVDVDKANRFVKAIGGDVTGTFTPSVLSRKGSFGALFALAKGKYKEPVLVSSTDGVGTKLLIAQHVGQHDTVGIDLVAMNVNDILCTGAKPLFFLDYIACGKLEAKVLGAVVKGIAQGCRLSGCALVGGETAEMPGMYKPGEYDLAGFAVGVVEKGKIIDGSAIRAGDKIIGLPSSGLHSNGFSLVRKVLSLGEQKRFAQELLTPTRIYAEEVLSLTRRFRVKGIAHITGGAFYDKLTRILPDGKCCVVHQGSWPAHKIFQILQKKGRISAREMYRAFNMGIGLAMVFAPGDVRAVQTYLEGKKIRHYLIGDIVHDADRKIIFQPLERGRGKES